MSHFVDATFIRRVNLCKTESAEGEANTIFTRSTSFIVKVFRQPATFTSAVAAVRAALPQKYPTSTWQTAAAHQP